LMEQLATEFFDAVCSADHQGVARRLAGNPQLAALRSAQHFGGTALTIACSSNDREMVELLLNGGADIEQKSEWEAGPWSPLQTALCYGHRTLAEYLLERGASLDAHAAAGLGDLVHEKGGDGCRPLHFACSVDVAACLLECGAEIDARDIDHHSTAAQYLSQHYPEVSRYLLDQGSQPDIFVAVLSDHRELAAALIEADPAVLDWRLSQAFYPPGADPEVHNIMVFIVGRDAPVLHAAAALNRVDMIDLLVANGADVHATGAYDDCSALHLAAWNNRPEAVRRLVAAGADIDQRSGALHDNSPAGWAIVSGADEAFEALRDLGAQMLEYFERDAKAAVEGEFRQFGNRDEAAQRRILKAIEN